jgi:flagellar basal body-associated protein FliL
MTQNSIAGRGLDKRKACVFLILVAVGVLCICALAYMLFYATPHSNTTIKEGGHSLVRQESPPPPNAPGNDLVRS